MQSKIRSGAINEVCNSPLKPYLPVLKHVSIVSVHEMQYKKEVETMLEVARSYIKSKTSGGEIEDAPSSSSPVLQDAL